MYPSRKRGSDSVSAPVTDLPDSSKISVTITLLFLFLFLKKVSSYVLHSAEMEASHQMLSKSDFHLVSMSL